MGLGDRSHGGGVEQRLDVNEQGEEITCPGSSKRKHRVAMSVADADSSIVTAN
jgi:hypothetical protein